MSQKPSPRDPSLNQAKKFFTLTPKKPSLDSILLISAAEIIKYMHVRPVIKAAGCDHQSPKLLRLSLPYILSPLCDTLNREIIDGGLP